MKSMELVYTQVMIALPFQGHSSKFLEACDDNGTSLLPIQTLIVCIDKVMQVIFKPENGD
jgi:hypothetical protein